MRCTPVGCTPWDARRGMHVRDIRAYETPAHQMHAREVQPVTLPHS
jgi:hypothetical protein